MIMSYASSNTLSYVSTEAILCYFPGKSVQEFELTADTTAEGVQIPLKYVKFQTVNSLTMFVRDNQGKLFRTRLLKIWFYYLIFLSNDQNYVSAKVP